MIIPPSPELKEAVSLVKDIIVGVAALFTIALGMYGLHQWRREHQGKEAFSLVRNLVKESHKMVRACTMLRQPIFDSERKIFRKEELDNFTQSERWKISEKEAYDKRFNKFIEAHDSYKESALEARAALGSHIYAAFLDFGKRITENVNAVNKYLDRVLDESFVYSSSSEEELQQIRREFLIQARTDADDELNTRTMDAREAGELALLKYLGRKSIRG